MLSSSDPGQGQATEPQPSGDSTPHNTLLSASRTPTYITSSLKTSLAESIPASVQPLHRPHLNIPHLVKLQLDILVDVSLSRLCELITYVSLVFWQCLAPSIVGAQEMVVE